MKVKVLSGYFTDQKPLLGKTPPYIETVLQEWIDQQEKAYPSRFKIDHVAQSGQGYITVTIFYTT